MEEAIDNIDAASESMETAVDTYKTIFDEVAGRTRQKTMNPGI